MLALLMNGDLERFLEEAIVVYLKELSCHLPRGTEKNTKNLSPYSQSLGRDLNWGHPESEVEVLTSRP
jgi:hypothetical protein